MENELIEKIIREHIEERLSDYSFDIFVKDILESIIRQKIKVDLEYKIEEIVKNEISEYTNNILNKEVRIDDGWGNREKYDNFEEMFKKTLKKTINDNYKINREITTIVNKRIREIEEQKVNKIKDEIIDKVLSESSE